MAGQIHRRTFLGQGLGMVGLGASVPPYLAETARAAPTPDSDRCAVIIWLGGGNDAMSSLVPYGYEEYGKLRDKTRIPEKEVIKLDDKLGLHPNLKGLKEMMDEDACAVIPGVGYPNSSFSHFTGRTNYRRASWGEDQSKYGWVGRAMDVAYPDSRDPTLALAVGYGSPPQTIVGNKHRGLALNRPDSFQYRYDRGKERAELYQKLNRIGVDQMQGNPKWVAETALNANQASDEIRKLSEKHKPKVEYPNSGLAKELRIVAGLIVGGLNTRVFCVSTGGFDTHNSQRDNHDKLMKRLNDAVYAFYQDLAKHGQAHRALTLTWTDFGRRAKENGNEGTDHGAAAAQFLVGPGVKAGIHGEHPSLSDRRGGGGGSLKHTTDFRSMYATVLEKWLEIPSKPVVGKHPLIDCIA